MQLAFDDYLADCLASDCPLGATVEEAEGKVADLLQAVAVDPLDTGVPERPLTQAYAFYGIAEPLYPEDEWSTLTEALVAAFDSS